MKIYRAFSWHRCVDVFFYFFRISSEKGSVTLPRPIVKYLGGTVPWIKIGDATLGDNIYINRTKEHILSTKKHFFLRLGRKSVPNQHSYASIRIKSTHMMTKSTMYKATICYTLCYNRGRYEILYMPL